MLFPVQFPFDRRIAVEPEVRSKAGRMASAVARVSRAVDELVAVGSDRFDLLGRSDAATEMLEVLEDLEEQPLLNGAATASLIAVTPADGLVCARARVESVLQTIAPFNAHVISGLLSLVAPCARDTPRSALLISLLTVALFGRGGLSVRADGGLAAWKAAHLFFIHTLEVSASRGLGHAVPFTRCMQLPVASLCGATVELAEALIEGVQIAKQAHESNISFFERRKMPLAGAILVVEAEAPLTEEAAWDAALDRKSVV